MAESKQTAESKKIGELKEWKMHFVITLSRKVQGSAKRQSPGLVNFVTPPAYHFCLALPAAFTLPGDQLLAEPCVSIYSILR